MPKYNCELPKVRVYKGSRYIPKFAEPLQWSPENEYEELTVVYSCGQTFISKTKVPAGVGLPEPPEIQNQYWALYADYNAQLEQYRAEVRSFSTRYDQMYCYLKAEIERLEQKVEEYYETLTQQIENLQQYVDNSITNLRNEINNNQSVTNVTFGDFINKVYGGGQMGEDGHITWGDPGKIAVGNINHFSGSTSAYIRTRYGEQNNDTKLV